MIIVKTHLIMEKFVAGKINHYANMIVNNKDKADELAIGELNFYMAFRRMIKGEGTTQDKGMMDAINDVLQHKGLVENGKTFYN